MVAVRLILGLYILAVEGFLVVQAFFLAARYGEYLPLYCVVPVALFGAVAGWPLIFSCSRPVVDRTLLLLAVLATGAVLGGAGVFAANLPVPHYPDRERLALRYFAWGGAHVSFLPMFLFPSVRRALCRDEAAPPPGQHPASQSYEPEAP